MNKVDRVDKYYKPVISLSDGRIKIESYMRGGEETTLYRTLILSFRCHHQGSHWDEIKSYPIDTDLSASLSEILSKIEQSNPESIIGFMAKSGWSSIEHSYNYIRPDLSLVYRYESDPSVKPTAYFRLHASPFPVKELCIGVFPELKQLKDSILLSGVN